MTCRGHCPRRGRRSVATGWLACWAAWLVLAWPSVTVEAAAGTTIPAAAVRVDFDLDGITGSYAVGFADQRAGRAITPDDPVRVASISKLVVAIAVLRLVEQGRLDLDADVGNYLGWPVRHPQYPGQPITLALLLSHRAALSDAAGYVADTGTRLQTQLAQPGAWDAAHAPGTWFNYANLGYPVVAAVLERVTGSRFDRLMTELVLHPLGLAACFNWADCDHATLARAVVLRDAEGEVRLDDLQGRRPPCAVLAAPDGSCDLDAWQAGANGGLFSPQGGLRISALGLARVGRLLLNDGAVDGVRLLTPASVAQLFEPRWTWDGSNGHTAEGELHSDHGAFFCRYGLGSQTLATRFAGCGDDLFGDGRERVGHAGEAYGLVSGLWLDRERGTGTAYFITGGDLTRAGKHSAFYAVEEELVGRPQAGVRSGAD